MEQIDIGLVIDNPYSRWSKADESERNEMLARFPHSVLVAASWEEVEFTGDWLARNIGLRGNNWEFIFYYKQAYDFGYGEYFFQEEGSSIIFRNEIPKFYGVAPMGKN